MFYHDHETLIEPCEQFGHQTVSANLAVSLFSSRVSFSSMFRTVFSYFQLNLSNFAGFWRFRDQEQRLQHRLGASAYQGMHFYRCLARAKYLFTPVWSTDFKSKFSKQMNVTFFYILDLTVEVQSIHDIIL